MYNIIIFSPQALPGLASFFHCAHCSDSNFIWIKIGYVTELLWHINELEAGHIKTQILARDVGMNTNLHATNRIRTAVGAPVIHETELFERQAMDL